MQAAVVGKKTPLVHHLGDVGRAGLAQTGSHLLPAGMVQKEECKQGNSVMANGLCLQLALRNGSKTVGLCVTGLILLKINGEKRLILFLAGSAGL